MSGPQVLPTLGSLTKAKGDCMCPISPGSIGAAPVMPCVVDERLARSNGGCA